jgi:excisionase family DNA binding protein
MGTGMNAEERFSWGVSEVAEYLGRAVSWTYDNYRPLGIPYIKVGQAVRFKPREVEEWAEAQRLTAA